MACCSALLYLLSLVLQRGSSTQRVESSVVSWIVPERPSPSSAARLTLASCGEFGAAIALVWWMTRNVPGHEANSTAMHVMATWSSASDWVAILTATALIAGYRFLAAESGMGRHRELLLWFGGVAVVAGGMCGWLSKAAASSHLAMMAQVELLGTVGPVLLALAAAPMIRHRRAGPTATGPLLGLAGAVVWVGVLYWWHLPGAHAYSSVETAITRPVSLLLAGLLLWGTCLGTIASATTYRSRFLHLLFAQEMAAVLGLALIISSSPLLGMHGGPLSPIVDQRAAGLLMMAVDVAVAIPVLRWLARRAADSGLPVSSSGVSFRSLPRSV